MAQVNKIDSNFTGLRIAEELGTGGIGTVSGAEVWTQYQPNSYEDLGGEISTVARNPINDTRQRQKGVVTDLDADGGFQVDLVDQGLQEIIQGFFFADAEGKSDVGEGRQPRRAGVTFEDYLVTDVSASDEITVDSRVGVTAAVVAGGTLYAVGDLIEGDDGAATVTSRWLVTGETGGVVDTVALVLSGFTGARNGRAEVDTGAGITTTAITGNGDDALTITITYGNGITWQTGDIVLSENFDDSPNNGILTVLSVADNVITFNETLTTDGTPDAAVKLTTVGFTGGAGDIDVAVAGDYVEYTGTGSVDWTTMGLIPGEWIFVGGDLAAEAFVASANNGFKRIRSISATQLVVDRSDVAMTLEASTTETIKIFFGRVVRNRPVSTDIVRRTWQIERTLGAPDDAAPSEIQAEYIAGAVAGEITFNFNTADKATVDFSFIGVDNEQIDGPTSLKAGTRPTAIAEDPYNTSSDFTRLHMAVHSDDQETTTALFAFLTEFTVSINNNLSPNKAVATLGAFDITAGQFIVSASATAYFSNVDAIASVRNNADVSIDYSLAHGAAGVKRGITMDVPLLSLGDGRANVEQDEPITLPLTIDAGADRVFNHTLLMMFYDFLPDVADTA